MVAENKKMIESKEKAFNEARDAMALKSSFEKRIRDLENESKRKKQLALQAVAARGGMKQHLDDALAQIEAAAVDKVKMTAELKRTQEEMMRYQKKHDEMFESVNGLNNRIEELEQHKLHLLGKLKNYGDKGDLDYIIKTQKLDNVKHKGFESRVVVEDYNPQKRRLE
jgi:phage shock protein A